jgi:6-pyruvoyltetrahydropterin/6-carboxytetrahydropterin synthase
VYKIKIITQFSAAHFLRNYKGKCESLHGHNWKVEAVIGSAKLDKAGMVMDFSDLKAATNGIIDKLDHKQINEIDYFRENNPSSEVIARFIFDRLKLILDNDNLKVIEVNVWETDTSCASYSGEEG